MAISKNGQPILTLEDWQQYAGPKRDFQWQDHKSAKEAARCWLGVTSPALPAELEAMLASHAAFGPVLEWRAEPEVRLPFDDFAGEPRNTDLLLYARDRHGDYLIAVEAKVDESFGATIANTIAAAKNRKETNPRSNGVPRVDGLLEGILGPQAVVDPGVQDFRYQLLTAAAGAVNAGRGAKVERVILLVQEFATKTTTPTKQAANAKDLERFVARLSNRTVGPAQSGELYGPFYVPGAPLFPAPIPALYVGKIVCDVRGSDD